MDNTSYHSTVKKNFNRITSSMKFLILLLTAVLAVEFCDIVMVEDTRLKIYEHLEERSIPEDAKLTVPELIEKYGYPIEVHKVTTSDGYILELQRIPHGKNGSTGTRKPVLVQHGLLCSSADWIIPGPTKGLGYILADAGYDVWLANSRGTRYSRNHTSWSPNRDAKRYWNFSWHDLALYDLPAVIDYILAQTKEKTINYIGHSQGTTIFYVLCSEKPKYNEKINIMISLAPVAFMKYMTSPILRVISPMHFILNPLIHLLGMYEFLPHDNLLSKVAGTLCGHNAIFQILCTNSLFAMLGFNKKQMNASLIPVITGHTPSGASTMQIIHYAQLHVSGKFRQYHYGVIPNLKYYGYWFPPEYNLNKVTVPVYLYYSRNDWMSNEKDVLQLINKLGNVKGKFLVPDDKFNHADYLFGIDAPKLLYARFISLMQNL